MVDDLVSNLSENRPFDAVVQTRFSRRHAMVGGMATAAVAFFGGTQAVGATAAGSAPAMGRRPLIGFSPIELGFGPEPAISDDYEFQTFLAWGEPLEPGMGPFTWPMTSAAEQEKRVGIGHDGMWFFGQDGHGMLCVNHEFGRTSHVLGKPVPESEEDVRIMQAAHGVTVAHVVRRKGIWNIEWSPNNRRIHVNTPVEFSGPVAGSALLHNDAGNEYQGTLNNCANGYTPWGTYLTCEENFNGYFGTTDETWEPTPEQDRYGFNTTGFGYEWFQFDPRFDLADAGHTNEANRFGWVVEIDPRKPHVKPTKRTALGRFKHEGAAVTKGRGGRIVVYMGDDQRFDYIYKFVSDGNWRAMRAKGQSPLDHGTLYAARFDDDGTGQWLELSMHNPDVAAVLPDMESVLTYARVAADAAGATPMDRPEWTTVAPNGDVYCTLTNNSRREEPNAANPLAPNENGHIIRWRDADNHVGTSFKWDIFLISDEVGEFGSPDGIWADPAGRLFIQTDGSQPDGANDQMLVADTRTGEMKRLFTGVEDCEITGLAVVPGQRTIFCNVQHPGNGDPTVTSFPAPADGVTVPRDATVVITKKNGGAIGS